MVYPRRHALLAQKILQSGGALLSEYGADEPLETQNFIARNRIVSGLCHAVLIVEAPIPSGALSTARFALEQNREVFIAPGPLTDTFAGSHMLLRQGAQLAVSPADILRDLGRRIVAVDWTPPTPLATDTTESVLSALRNSSSPLSVDKLAQGTKLQPRAVQQALAVLLFEESVREHADGYSAASSPAI
jgi:predicted Rossmann fold nucleotide-binding protein DprA/Smf involved in DNA uptake